MIMPISAATVQTKPLFRGAIAESEFLADTVSHFTKMEQNRWGGIKTALEQQENNLMFQVYQKVLQIGKTIIKSVVIQEEKAGVLGEDVYNITKGGSVIMYNRELLARTILDSIEGMINKK